MEDSDSLAADVPLELAFDLDLPLLCLDRLLEEADLGLASVSVDDTKSGVSDSVSDDSISDSESSSSENSSSASGSSSPPPATVTTAFLPDDGADLEPVSYTHLTLPPILLV